MTLTQTNWLEEKKKAAKGAYQSASLPDRVSHLWKYTDPSIFLSDINKDKSNKPKIEFSIDESTLKKGVVLLEINQAFKDKNDLVQNYFDKLVLGDQDKINLLNQALWSTGYFLYVPKGIKIEKPIIVKSSSD